MKTVFRLRGLGCANCAAEMEKKIARIDGVTSGTVSFATAKLTIEGDGDKMPGIIDSARAIIKKIEPDVVMEQS